VKKPFWKVETTGNCKPRQITGALFMDISEGVHLVPSIKSPNETFSKPTEVVV
jgi:hypothetical protein